MNLTVISELLKELIPFHSQISLPGLGSFIIHEKPSEITDNGTVITPPIKSLGFSFAHMNNDSLLEKEYSRLYNKDLNESRLYIEKISKELRSQLTTSKKVNIPNLGDFKFNEDGELIFIASEDKSVFSLINLPLQVNLVPKTQVTTHTEDYNSITPPTFNQSWLQNILDGALQASIVTKNCKDAATPELNEMQAKEQPDSDIFVKKISQIVQQSIEVRNIVQDIHKNNMHDNNIPQDQSVPETSTSDNTNNIEIKGIISNESAENTVGAIDTDAIEEKNNVEDVKDVEDTKNIEDVKSDKKSQQTNSEKKDCHTGDNKIIPTKYKIILTLIIIVIILLLILIIVYLLKDELKPLLELLLYNSDERAILRHFNL